MIQVSLCRCVVSGMSTLHLQALHAIAASCWHCISRLPHIKFHCLQACNMSSLLNSRLYVQVHVAVLPGRQGAAQTRRCASLETPLVVQADALQPLMAGWKASLLGAELPSANSAERLASSARCLLESFAAASAVSPGS